MPPNYLHPAEVQSMCMPGQAQYRSSMEYTKYSSFECTSVEYVCIQGRQTKFFSISISILEGAKYKYFC
jgi:hypothetical protein